MINPSASEEEIALTALLTLIVRLAPRQRGVDPMRGLALECSTFKMRPFTHDELDGNLRKESPHFFVPSTGLKVWWWKTIDGSLTWEGDVTPESVTLLMECAAVDLRKGLLVQAALMKAGR